MPCRKTQGWLTVHHVADQKGGERERRLRTPAPESLLTTGTLACVSQHSVGSLLPSLGTYSCPRTSWMSALLLLSRDYPPFPREGRICEEKPGQPPEITSLCREHCFRAHMYL